MAIRIISKKDGFRRCGMAHSADPQVYPDDKFTDKELEILKAEPMLTVESVRDEDEGAKKTTDGSPAGDEDIDFEGMTKNQMIGCLDAEIEITPKIKKMNHAELVELCKDVEEERAREA